jgi:N-acetylmuramoyl-L-alanine amidase
MRNISWIILHCTAGPQDQTIEAIQGYWKNSLGWKTPGYHHIIRPDGESVNLQPIEKPSNGVKGHNHNSINISYIGGVVTASNDPVNAKGSPIDNRTDAQKRTQEELINKYHAQFPDAVILGHRDFSPDKNRNGIIEPSEWIKSCPSFSVKSWLDEIHFKTQVIKVQLKTTSRVNIRSGPGVSFAPVHPVLDIGEEVTRVAEADGWIYVTYKEVKGWVMGAYLK